MAAETFQLCSRLHERRDFIGIRHLIRGERPALGIYCQRHFTFGRDTSPDDIAGNIARSQGGGEAQTEGATVVIDRLQIADIHPNGFTGRNIRDLVGKQVRALLFQQCCAFTRSAGCPVYPRRLLTFAYLADNTAFADLDFKSIDGGLLGQRQHVDRLLPLLRAVDELLLQAHFRHQPAHGNFRVAGQVNRRHILPLRPTAEQQIARLHVIQGDSFALPGYCRRLLRPCAHGRDKYCQRSNQKQQPATAAVAAAVSAPVVLFGGQDHQFPRYALAGKNRPVHKYPSAIDLLLRALKRGNAA